MHQQWRNWRFLPEGEEQASMVLTIRPHKFSGDQKEIGFHQDFENFFFVKFR